MEITVVTFAKINESEYLWQTHKDNRRETNAGFDGIISDPYTYQIRFLSPLVPAGSAWELTLDVVVGLLVV